MVELSTTEITAENIYNLFRGGKMGEISFIQNFVNLAHRNDTNGIMYLTWLLSKSKKRYIKKLLKKAILNVKI